MSPRFGHGRAEAAHGRGQLVELSMQEALTYFLRTTIAIGSKWGSRASERRGNDLGPLTGLFPCAPFGDNDYLYIMALTPRMWRALCETIGRPELADDPRFARSKTRRENEAELRPLIEAWTRQRTKREAMKALADAGVPASMVFDTLDLFEDPHLVERGFVHTLEHPRHGPIRLLGWPARMSASTVEMRLAPSFGEHSAEVLAKDLGLDEDAVEALRERGVVGRIPTDVPSTV